MAKTTAEWNRTKRGLTWAAVAFTVALVGVEAAQEEGGIAGPNGRAILTVTLPPLTSAILYLLLSRALAEVGTIGPGTPNSRIRSFGPFASRMRPAAFGLLVGGGLYFLAAPYDRGIAGPIVYWLLLCGPLVALWMAIGSIARRRAFPRTSAGRLV